jgi:hypothetical protein
LLGRHFVWETDHKPLEHWQDAPSDRVARWYEKLRRFRFSFKYIPGEQNVVADALSRAPVDSPGHPLSPHPIPQAQIAAMRARAAPEADREPVPQEFRAEVLRRYHDALGHPGADIVLQELRQKYKWENMEADAKDYVRSCKTCQHTSGGDGDLQWVDTSEPTAPWQKVSLDTLGVPEWDKIVVGCVDQFSKFLQARVVDGKDAASVMAACCDMLFFQDGRPLEVLTDNGTEFVFMEEFSKRFGFKWWTISTRHPQSNGMIERVQRTLIDKCLKISIENPTLSHERVLQLAVFQYNNTIHHSTGYPPNLIHFGRNVQPPKRVLKQTQKPRIGKNTPLDSFIKQQAEALGRLHEEVSKNITEAKGRRRSQSPSGKPYAVGQKVMLSNYATGKMTVPWLGPYAIDAVLEGGVYRLKRVGRFQEPIKIAHHNQLKAFVDRPSHLIIPGEQGPPEIPPRRLGRPPKVPAQE